MFLSQRPNNDPEPWINEDGVRERRPAYIEGAYPHKEPIYSPRIQFTETKDPMPWESLCGHRHEEDQSTEGSGYWRPRHEEFDTPVNPILADYRSYHNGPESAVRWLRDREWIDYPAEDHARRVLSKLVAVYS